jgi:hypothetical protein
VLYFIDTEFIELGPNKPIHFLSLGVVREDGAEFYVENADAPFDLANDWVKENVFPYLNINKYGVPFGKIKWDLLNFMRDDSRPRFWANCGAYDWVVLCQLFGDMNYLPSTFPFFCNDIKQLQTHLLCSNLPKQGSTKHNALNDAWHTKQCWEHLKKYGEEKGIILNY